MVCSDVPSRDAVKLFLRWIRVSGLKNRKVRSAGSAKGRWFSFFLITTKSRWVSWSFDFGVRAAWKNLTGESHRFGSIVTTVKATCTSFFTSLLEFRVSQPSLRLTTRKLPLNRSTHSLSAAFPSPGTVFQTVPTP